jgi:SMC interacting uncharacterized protein involved in chromosome segregation
MKLENLNRAINLKDKLQAINIAVTETKKAIDKKDKHFYRGILSEYSDGSGFKISLENTDVLEDILAFTLKMLLLKKIEIEKEIESL